MKNLAITALLTILVVIGVFAALNVPAAPMGTGVWPVSDKVTAPDSYWEAPHDLQGFINQK